MLYTEKKSLFRVFSWEGIALLKFQRYTVTAILSHIEMSRNCHGTQPLCVTVGAYNYKCKAHRTNKGGNPMEEMLTLERFESITATCVRHYSGHSILHWDEYPDVELFCPQWLPLGGKALVGVQRVGNAEKGYLPRVVLESVNFAS